MAQAPLPEKVVDALLDRLATDDAFRDQFAKDPGAAFKALGFSPSKDQLACMTCKNGLADKQAIGRVRDEMREKLVLGTLGLVPNKLDS